MACGWCGTDAPCRLPAVATSWIRWAMWWSLPAPGDYQARGFGISPHPCPAFCTAAAWTRRANVCVRVPVRPPAPFCTACCSLCPPAGQRARWLIHFSSAKSYDLSPWGSTNFCRIWHVVNISSCYLKPEKLDCEQLQSPWEKNSDVFLTSIVKSEKQGARKPTAKFWSSRKNTRNICFSS